MSQASSCPRRRNARLSTPPTASSRSGELEVGRWCTSRRNSRSTGVRWRSRATSFEHPGRESPRPAERRRPVRRWRRRLTLMPASPLQQQLEAAHCWEADDRVPGRPAMTAYRRAAALPPGAVARGARPPDRHATDRAAARRSRSGPSAAGSRSTTAATPAPTSSPPARLRRRARGPRSPSRTRASTTSGCGPTSCRRPR